MANLQTAVCIVGGGPAGVVLALLLARQGRDVTVLEKHKDFNRDFRGDTIHGATLRVMRELGLLNRCCRCNINNSITPSPHWVIAAICLQTLRPFPLPPTSSR